MFLPVFPVVADFAADTAEADDAADEAAAAAEAAAADVDLHSSTMTQEWRLDWKRWKTSATESNN